jgi:hypothetical protein
MAAMSQPEPHRSLGRAAWAGWAPLPLLLVFWWLSIWNIGRYPLIEEDEPWILSPGFKLFAQGVYGSDLFRGFHGMAQHYFEFMPLMSWSQGALSRLLGVGVLQMRWLPVALGALTLALTWALARRLTTPAVGLVAMALLLFWQWTPGSQRILGSGVPLIDLTRIARYDMLVAPLGLGAILCAWQARRTGHARYDVLSGVMGGLAGLAHVYGLFWLGGALVLRLAEAQGFSARRALRTAGSMLAGAAAPWALWMGLASQNWPDFLAQTAQYSDRFNLFDLSFYLDNLVREPSRYFLGLRQGTVLDRVGFWALVAGLPTAWVMLGVESHKRRERGLAWLWVLCAIFPVGFALLIRIKTFNYLISAAPLWVVGLAWGIDRLAVASRPGRWLAWGALGLIVIQGSIGVGHMQSYALQAEVPEKMFADLRQIIPPSGRILGPARYWLALHDHDYISLVLPFFLSNSQYSDSPVSLEAAIAQIAPQFVVVDLYSEEYQNDYAPPAARRQPSLLRAYLAKHHARLIAKLNDNYGQPIEVYQLGPG